MKVSKDLADMGGDMRGGSDGILGELGITDTVGGGKEENRWGSLLLDGALGMPWGDNGVKSLLLLVPVEAILVCRTCPDRRA